MDTTVDSFRGAPRSLSYGKSSRRTFLTLAAAGAAIATVGAGRAGATSGRFIPQTLAQTAGTGPVRASFPIELVGVRWAPREGAARIRFAAQTGRFGAWHELRPGCPAGAGDAKHTDTCSTLVPASRAWSYEIDAPPHASSVALNCTDGPAQMVPASARDTAELAGCTYLNRAAWGADESLRFDDNGTERFPPIYWPVQTITVHHTATVNDDPDPAARVRAIYRFQTIDENFGDIGYHFLIDEAGRIYEGRWSGDDGIPGFNPEGQMVNAAHVAGFNAGNVGIALLGTFTDQLPTAAAFGSLTSLLAGITGWLGIDPLATVHYVNPISGATRTVLQIPGHRDWAATLCPGDQLAAQLAQIRTEVANLLT